MNWVYLHKNRERVRKALLKGHMDEAAMWRATAFDALAAAMHELWLGSPRQKARHTRYGQATTVNAGPGNFLDPNG